MFVACNDGRGRAPYAPLLGIRRAAGVPLLRRGAPVASGAARQAHDRDRDAV